MKKTKNKFNLIYFTMNSSLVEEIHRINNQISKNENFVYSKKYNTNRLKVKVYDKVSTPFIDTTLFKDE